MSKIDEDHEKGLAFLRSFVGGINALSTIPPELFEATVQYVRALHQAPGATYVLDGTVMNIRMPDGQIAPGLDIAALAAEQMGQAVGGLQ